MDAKIFMKSDCNLVNRPDFEGTTVSFEIYGVLHQASYFELDGQEYDIAPDAYYCKPRANDKYISSFCEPFPNRIVTGDLDGNGLDDVVFETDDGVEAFLSFNTLDPEYDDLAFEMEMEKNATIAMNRKDFRMDWPDAVDAVAEAGRVDDGIIQMLVAVTEDPDAFLSEKEHAASHLLKAGLWGQAKETFLEVAKTRTELLHRGAQARLDSAFMLAYNDMLDAAEEACLFIARDSNLYPEHKLEAAQFLYGAGLMEAAEKAYYAIGMDFAEPWHNIPYQKWASKEHRKNQILAGEELINMGKLEEGKKILKAVLRHDYEPCTGFAASCALYNAGMGEELNEYWLNRVSGLFFDCTDRGCDEKGRFQ